jgi:predicted metal-dependent hydrolase
MLRRPHHGNLNAGLDLFNRGLFFDAHEVLEDVWRPLPGNRPLRRHLQGMVQLAVAFHHQSTGNHAGASSVLERALRNLAGADSSFPELDLERLHADLEIWRRYLEDSDSQLGPAARDVGRRVAPALPKIHWRR